MKCNNRIISLLVLLLLVTIIHTFILVRSTTVAQLRGVGDSTTTTTTTTTTNTRGRNAVNCEDIDENNDNDSDNDNNNKSHVKNILCETMDGMVDIKKDVVPDDADLNMTMNRSDQKIQEEQSTRTETTTGKREWSSPSSSSSSSSIAHVTNDDVIHNLHFYIRTKSGKRGGRKNCGGCEMLWDLYDEIAKRGVSVDTQSDIIPENDYICPTDEMLSQPLNEGKTIVFVYPETSKAACTKGSGNRVHVRWLLAPLGALVEKDRWKLWGSDELVFSYSSAVASIPDLPVSNILQIVSSPTPGDSTDVSKKEFFNQKGRSGITWMLRKAAPYKDILTYVHKHHGLSYWQNERPNIPDDFLKYEYFVSYDLYTYFTFAAAMVGTVSVVAPIEGFTKHQWLRGTYVGEYMEATGEPVPGIAYGWDEKELEFARKTMFELRNYMFKVRAWGREATVPRFMRDCYRYSQGAQNSTQMEGGMLVSESFSDDLKGPLQKYFDTHAHTTLGHHNVVEDNDVTDDGYTGGGDVLNDLSDNKDDGYGFPG